ncbi:MAG TPA: hypothetical protein PL072_12435 [Phycisphaerales bacterium]|nr:hypothetical protein [Phycisphaerales bacterium]
MSAMGSEAARMGTADMKADVEALKAEIGRLREDLASTAKTAASLGKHGFEAARDRAGAAYETAKERVTHVAGVARDRSKQAVDRVETTIEDHPLASVAVAFGAGLLLGALLRGR